jgi:hypothetical protein
MNFPILMSFLESLHDRLFPGGGSMEWRRSWLSQHPVSGWFSILTLVSSVIVARLIPASIRSVTCRLFVVADSVLLVPYVLFMLLLSGVEPSVGSPQYGIWMFWSAIVLRASRSWLHLTSSGPSFAVFCPFITFLAIHKPILYFRLFRFRFSDWHLYLLAMIQFICLDFSNLSIDFLVCLSANLVWKIVQQYSRNNVAI